MCISAAVLAGLSLAASATGTVASISAAKTNAKMQRYQLDEQKKQLNEEREIARLQAMEAENTRLEEFRRQRAANLAAIAASGVGENRSFLQGIAPAEEKALRLDLRNIRMGNTMAENRLAAQIRVNRLSRDVAGINARNQIIGAAAGFIGDAASIGTNYKKATS